MRHRSLSGWPVIAAAFILPMLLLMNLAVYRYRQSAPVVQAATVDPRDTRIEALEAEVAALKQRQARTSLEGYNEVYVNGRFVGLKKHDGGLIRGIYGAGYTERPVGAPPLSADLRATLGGRGLRLR